MHGAGGDATLEAPPNASDRSYVWLPPSYDPGTSVVVGSPGAAAVTVTNTVDRLEATFQLTKSVVGAGKDAGYDGGAFTFSVVCTLGGATLLNETVVHRGRRELDAPGGGDLPLGTTCTITETAGARPTSPAFGWDPVQFTVEWQREQGSLGGVQIADDVTAPVQINATNPINPRTRCRGDHEGR